MGKKYKNKTKKTQKGKKAKEIKRKKIKIFGSKPIQQRENISKISKTYNILNTYNSFIYPSITELIQSLDDKDLANTTRDFYLKFPSNLNDREFIKLFKEGINYAKRNFKFDNLKILKEILLLLKDNNNVDSSDEFGLEICKNNKLLKVFKFDLILRLLSDESKLEELEIKNVTDANEIRTKFINSIDYGLSKSDNEMKNAVLFNQNSVGVFSYQSFKNILFSPTIISLYKDILYELYNIKISKKELIKIVKEFINSHNIFFVRMSLTHFGMLLYNGTIIINGSYYSRTYFSQDAFVIYYNLLFEIMNAISYILGGNDNYLLNNNESNKNKKIKSDERGDYFANKFFFDVVKEKKLSVLEADYLVDIKNYQYDNIKDFHLSFKNWRKRNINAIKNSDNFIFTKSDITTFSIKIGCYCNGPRKNH